MGILIMLAVVVAAFFILKTFIGVLGAVLVSAVLFIGWFIFNIRASTTGTIKSNMQAYFLTRQKGANHQDALDRVIQTRYPLSEGKRADIRTRFNSKLPDRNDDEKYDLKHLVYVIFCDENGLPPESSAQRILNKIDKIYDSMSKKYGFSK